MRIYVAGPMTGIPDWNRPAFAAAVEALAAAGHEPVSPVHDDDLATDGSAIHPWAWYLRRDLKQLLECDGVAMLDGWVESRGASLEVSVAAQLDMPCRLLDEWLA